MPRIYDYMEDVNLILGIALIVVPVVIFLIYGIKNLRPILTTVSVLILAMTAFAFVDPDDETKRQLADGMNAILSDPWKIIVGAVVVAGMILFWCLIARVTTRRK